MADKIQGGYLRSPAADGSLGPLIVQGPGGSPLPVSTSSGALAAESATRVATATAPATLLVANTARKSASVYNDSGATLYVKHGSAASGTDFKIAIPAGGYYELPFPLYVGAITGALSTGTGNAQVCEGS